MTVPAAKPPTRSGRPTVTREHLVAGTGVAIYASVANGPRPTLYLDVRTASVTTKIGPLTIDETQQLIDMLGERLTDMVK